MWVVIILVRTRGTFWYQNNSDLLKFFDFELSTPPASVSEAMNVTYATPRHQQIMTSLMTSLVSHFDDEKIFLSVSPIVTIDHVDLDWSRYSVTNTPLSSIWLEHG